MKSATALLVGAFLLTAHAAAGQTGPDDPLLRTKLEPATAMVGQMTTLTIEVLAPNYLLGPPQMPDFQIRNAITRPLDRINISETRNGATYAGIRSRFGLYALEPGRYQTPAANVVVRYADPPPNAREQTLTLSPLTLDAFVPEAARGLTPFIPASRLIITQTIDQSSFHLKVGDAITRTVKIQATDLPAMLLPPLKRADIKGLSAYSAPPVLNDETERRSDRVIGIRTEQTTYIVQKAGHHALPAIDLPWWNVTTNAIERSQVDGFDFDAEGATGANTTNGSSPLLPLSLADIWTFIASHWLAFVSSLAALLTAGWLTFRYARDMLGWLQQQRARYRRSEHHAFTQLRAAARRSDAAAIYRALLRWLDHFADELPGDPVSTLKTAAANPQLDSELSRLEALLFGPESNRSQIAVRLSARSLIAARRHLKSALTRRQSAQRSDTRLNPHGVNGPAGNIVRPVAR